MPFALEGAAWVMAAGVAYADEAKLPGWVRWLLRGLSMTAAAFAARVNYLHGSQTNAVVGWGLAAVTLLGPLFFEVRQWVTSIAAVTATPKQQADAKARAAHAKKRRRQHKDVARIADRLISAAPFGSLSDEDAWRAAWEITHGTRSPGMTPALHAAAVASRTALEAALTEGGMTPEAAAVELFLADVFGPGRGEDGTDGGTAPGGPEDGPRGGGDDGDADCRSGWTAGSGMPPLPDDRRDSARGDPLIQDRPDIGRQVRQEGGPGTRGPVVSRWGRGGRGSRRSRSGPSGRW